MRAKLNVLVAEDDELIRDFVVRILASAGHCAHPVDNGDEALAELQKGGYDIAILDVLMPGPGGLEIAERYRGTHEKSIPIVVLTASAIRSSRSDHLASSGVNVLLTKPVTRHELLDTIEKVAAGITPAASGDPATRAQGILDQRKLDELVFDDPTGEFRKNFLKKFMSRSIDVVHQIEQAVQEGNQADVYELTHKLAGSAGTAGALAIENACGALRSDMLLPSAQDRVTELKRAVSEVARLLNQKYDIGAQE